MNYRRFLCLILLALLVALPAAAQEDLTFGETVEGEFTEDNPTVEFTFQGEEGQLVVILQQSDEVDSYLVLEGPDGTIIAENDDAGGNYNALIGPIALPETGEYTIIADTYAHRTNPTGGGQAGAFEVTLQMADARRIELTQEVKGELAADDAPDYYLFTGQEGDVIDILVQADEGDVLLSLSRDGVQLMSADTTYSDNHIAVIPGFTLSETGEYLIAVNSPTGEAAEYSLELDRVEVQEIAYGDTLEAVFDEETAGNFYTFAGEAGDVINITVDSGGELDTTLTLNAPDGYQLAYADDVNDVDPALTGVILSTAGTYSILVETYSPGDVGTATVTLERGELLSLDEGPQTVEVTPDDATETLTFQGQAGERVRLIVDVTKGGPASPYIQVNEQDGTMISSLGATAVYRVSMDVEVPVTGLVYVRIDDSSFNDLSYQVALERLGAGEAGDGAAETAEPVATAISTIPASEGGDDTTDGEVTATEPPDATEPEETPVVTEPAVDVTEPPVVEEPEVTPDVTEVSG